MTTIHKILIATAFTLLGVRVWDATTNKSNRQPTSAPAIKEYQLHYVREPDIPEIGISKLPIGEYKMMQIEDKTPDSSPEESHNFVFLVENVKTGKQLYVTLWSLPREIEGYLSGFRVIQPGKTEIRTKVR